MYLSISHSLCSAVHNCDSLCRRSSRSPIMLSILLVLLGERERAHLVIQLRLFFYIFIYIIYIRVVRRALNLLRASFSPKFLYFSAVNVTPVSFFQIFQTMYATPCAMEFYSSPLDCLGLNSSAMDSCAMDSSALNSSAMDSSAIFYTTSQVLIAYCYASYKQNPNKCIVHVLCRCCCTCR